MAFVPQLTFLPSPRHGLACSRNPRTSAPNASRSAKTSGDGRDGGMIMRKDSSVSRFAEREFRLVDPKRVRMGGDVGVGDSQIPAEAIHQRQQDFEIVRVGAHPWRDMSTRRAPTHPALFLQYRPPSIGGLGGQRGA
jgi:hypothetical protein